MADVQLEREDPRLATQIHEGVRAWQRLMLVKYGRIPHRICAGCGAPTFRRYGQRCDECLKNPRLGSSISSATKIAVLLRDGPWCRHCRCRVRAAVRADERAHDVVQFDHFPIPASCGGRGSPDNVVVSCSRCNESRGARFYTPTVDEAST
jgi:hypothetical protein